MAHGLLTLDRNRIEMSQKLIATPHARIARTSRISRLLGSGQVLMFMCVAVTCINGAESKIGVIVGGDGFYPYDWSDQVYDGLRVEQYWAHGLAVCGLHIHQSFVLQPTWRGEYEDVTFAIGPDAQVLGLGRVGFTASSYLKWARPDRRMPFDTVTFGVFGTAHVALNTYSPDVLIPNDETRYRGLGLVGEARYLPPARRGGADNFSSWVFIPWSIAFLQHSLESGPHFRYSRSYEPDGQPYREMRFAIQSLFTTARRIVVAFDYPEELQDHSMRYDVLARAACRVTIPSYRLWEFEILPRAQFGLAAGLAMTPSIDVSLQQRVWLGVSRFELSAAPACGLDYVARLGPGRVVFSGDLSVPGLYYTSFRLISFNVRVGYVFQ